MRRVSPILLVLLGLSLALSSCGPLLDPEIKELTSFKMGKGEGAMNFEVGLNVFNPNKMKISVLKYDLEVFVNGMNLGKAKSDEKQFLKKKEEKEIKVNVSTSLMKLLSGGLGMLANSGGKDLKVRIKGKVLGKAMGVKKNFDIDEELPVNINI